LQLLTNRRAVLKRRFDKMGPRSRHGGRSADVLGIAVRENDCLRREFPDAAHPRLDRVFEIPGIPAINKAKATTGADRGTAACSEVENHDLQRRAGWRAKRDERKRHGGDCLNERQHGMGEGEVGVVEYRREELAENAAAQGQQGRGHDHKCQRNDDGICHEGGKRNELEIPKRERQRADPCGERNGDQTRGDARHRAAGFLKAGPEFGRNE